MARGPMVPPAGPRLPRDVAPVGYQLTLELDPAQPSFRGSVTIDVAFAAPTDRLWLDARGLEIDDARLEVAGQAPRAIAATVVADRELVGFDLGAPVSGPARVTIAYRGPVLADDVVGLFRERVGDDWYLFSQFEAMHARRALPCFDEPGWKVPWQVTLVVPPALVAASNAPEAARTTRADGRVEVRFAPTPPMVSYLLAVAVGPFDVVDVGPVGRDKVPARILVPAGRAPDAATAAAETPRVVAALEAYFDRALPLAKLDQVAVPSFPGAMENLGLVTYGSEELLASPSRPLDELRREYLSIASHELAHQWFGNLVTMAWWDDLWLNESFATWLAAKLVADLDPRRDVITERRQSRADAMERDRRPRAPAVRRPVATPAEADAAFDPIAYDKGAAVLAMFERAMGADRFRDAVRAFLAAHAGGSVTSADFEAALAAAGGGADVAAGLETVLDQPGVPRVELALDCAGPGGPAAVASVSRATDVATVTATTATATAAAAAAPRWKFPLCVRFSDKKAGGGVGERCGWLDGPGGRVELGLAACPAWLVGDAGGAGYYQVAYTPALAASVEAHLADVPIVDRGTLADGVVAELSGGRTTIAGALGWARLLLAAPDRHDAIAALAILRAVDGDVGPDARPAWQAWLRATLGA
ncbi:MAG TPA: M1 family metallopeptidase, partial [Kofleriaceae bacterium]|nr:M1 family metallopeptidase [Kofleriaceae bacterium]